MGRLRRLVLLVVTVLLVALAVLPPAAGHGVDEEDRAAIEATTGADPVTFVLLGAEHMVTGYDHLLFLAGVLFFLHRMKDVVHYVTLFTLGHSLTLLAGVLGGIHANAHLVDAIIGLSVVYKGFDNLGGFRRLLGFQPNTKAAVLVFGLFHGFGLATKVQELHLTGEGLLTNMLSFNVGVEVGQVLALTVILVALTLWRRVPDFERHALVANTVIMAGGFMLMGYQLTGYVLGGA